MKSYWRLEITCDRAYTDILLAELAAAGYDGFEETPEGLVTYSPVHPDETPWPGIAQRYARQARITWRAGREKARNWNEAWEKSYQPVTVGDRCIVRAAFHPPRSELPIEIVITPQMSFGTGHHATTWLMLNAQLGLDHRGKKVLEPGCGTGILSIMAGKLGAAGIEAFDIDDWVVQNARENLALNGIEGRVFLGRLADLDLQPGYDLILANINKNVLLTDLPGYARLLAANGLLLLSGIYASDLPELEAAAARQGLRLLQKDQKDGWAMGVFVRQTA